MSLPLRYWFDRLFRKRPTLADIIDVSITCDESLTSAQRYERISGKLLDRDPVEWFRVKLAERLFKELTVSDKIEFDENDDFTRWSREITGWLKPEIHDIEITGKWEI